MDNFVKFLNVIKKDICNFRDYKTNSNRKEYFYWYLAVVIISIIFAIIVGFIMEFISVLGEILLSLFLAFVFIISLPLGIRRLRDIGKNPWFILIGLIPFAGPIILLVFFCRNSKKENDNIEEFPKYNGSSNDDLVDEKK